MLRSISKYFKCFPGCDPSSGFDEEPVFKEKQGGKQKVLQYLLRARSMKSTVPADESDNHVSSNGRNTINRSSSGEFKHHYGAYGSNGTPSPSLRRFLIENQALYLTEQFYRESITQSIPAYLEALTLGYDPNLNEPMIHRSSFSNVKENASVDRSLAIQKKFMAEYQELKPSF